VGASHPHHPTQRRRPAKDLQTMRALVFHDWGLRLASAYLSALGHEPPITATSGSTFAGCLDYIWVSAPVLPAAAVRGRWTRPWWSAGPRLWRAEPGPGG
jgi:hypothetical protein